MRDFNPAWIQAVGILIALGIAIWVPFKQNRDRARADESERGLKGGSLAIALFPELLELKAKIAGSKGLLEQIFAPGQVGALVEINPKLKIDLPEIIKSAVHHLYLLGPVAALPVQQLLATINQFNRMVDQANSHLRARAEPIDKYGGHVHLSTHLLAIETLVNEAISEIGIVHDRLIGRKA